MQAVANPLRPVGVANAAGATKRSSSRRPPHKAPPIFIEERTNGQVLRRYKRGRLLGKGGFAHCYLLTDLSSNKELAGKIIPKSALVKPKAKAKLLSEIEIHTSLHHRHIVEFLRYFEDTENVYIILELCPSQTMMELIKRRKRLTEAEVKFYTLQLVSGTRYIHGQKVIHRDLKLGNLFLDANMNVKFGDFGLATRVAHDGERKKTLCGTPNYIAPEVLQGRNGHSYEVDTWSIGVILYTLLVGRPPFETSNVKSTYKKIVANNYSFPEYVNLSSEAKDLVKRLLRTNPANRPSLSDILQHPFMAKADRIPRQLPIEAMHTVPHSFVAEANAALGIASSSSTSSALSSRVRPSSSSSALRQPLSSIGNRDALKKSAKDRISSAKSSTNSGGIYGSGRTSATDRPSSATSRWATSSSSNKRSTSPWSKRSTTATTSSTTRPSSSLAKLGSGSSASTATKKASSSSSTTAAAAAATKKSTRSTAHRGLDDDLNEDERGALHHMHHHLTISFAQQPTASKASTDIAGDNLDGDLKLGGASSSTATAAAKHLDGDPSLSPSTWVTKWVDYSNKYGLGYQLSDGTMGVYFNDSTKIALAADGSHVEYYDRKRTSSGSYDQLRSFVLDSHPEDLQKKVTLLKHFRNYLQEHNVAQDTKSYDDSPSQEMPYVKKWMLTGHAIIFRLSNKTVQVNFFDHTKIILSSEARVVTYVNKQRKLTSYPLATVLSKSRPELSKRLKYAKDILYQLISRSRPSGKKNEKEA